MRYESARLALGGAERMKRFVTTAFALASFCAHAPSGASPSIESVAFLEGCWAYIDPQDGSLDMELNLSRTPDGAAFKGRIEEPEAEGEGLTLSFSQDGATLVVENPYAPTVTLRTVYSRVAETPSGPAFTYGEAVATTAYSAEGGSGWIVIAHVTEGADSISINAVHGDGSSGGALFWGLRRVCPDV